MLSSGGGGGVAQCRQLLTGGGGKICQNLADVICERSQEVFGGILGIIWG